MRWTGVVRTSNGAPKAVSKLSKHLSALAMFETWNAKRQVPRTKTHIVDNFYRIPRRTHSAANMLVRGDCS